MKYAISNLAIAPENPRHDVDLTGIEELADNIEEVGLLNPLIGYEEPKGTAQIVAGGRRTRALKLLVERGFTKESHAVEVVVIPKHGALTIGAADNLSAVKMSSPDIIKLFLAGGIANDRSDSEIARLLGKSTRFVQQHRAMAALPDDVLNHFFENRLTSDQMIGLTYFLNAPQEDLMEVCEDALRSKWMDGNRIRDRFIRSQEMWNNRRERKHVEFDEYVAAGGGFEKDLFTDDIVIKNPEILVDLMASKAQAAVMAKYGDAGYLDIEQVEQFSYPRPEAIKVRSELSEADAKRLAELEEMQDADITAEIEAEHDELLDKSHSWTVPDEVKPFTKLLWCISAYSDAGYDVQEGVWPTTQLELEALKNLGYSVEAKTQSSNEGSDDEASKLSPRIGLDHRHILAHVARMELAKNTDQVLRDVVSAGKSIAYSVHFQRADDVLQTGTQVKNGKSYDALVDLHKEKRKSDDLTLAEAKRLLAFYAVNTVSSHIHTDATITAEMVREYWTPDAAYFGAYKKDQLVELISDISANDSEVIAKAVNLKKKSDLVVFAVQLSEANKTWLPENFF